MNRDHKEETSATRPARGFFAVVSAAMAVVAAVCGIAGGAAAGMWAAGGHSAAGAGALAMGSVGGIWLAGAAAALYAAVTRDGGNSRTAGIAATFALAASVAGSGLGGLAIGWTQQAHKDNTLAIPVSPELRRAFEAGIDRDRVGFIRKDIGDYAIRWLQKENAENFLLCSNNRDHFAKKGIDCSVYDPPPPLSKNPPAP